MARQGVFSRNDDTPENIPRSLQLLSHRWASPVKYMEIYPNFCEVLNPNESIRLKVTNFLRSIPMVTPQLSRVRLVQRFYAVPFRIMWQPWEDWIKGENDAQFMYELPYPVNCYSSSTVFMNGLAEGESTSETPVTHGNARRIVLDSSTGYVPTIASNSVYSNACLVNGIRELGDFLRYPVFSVLGYNQTSGKYLVPHAFKMCAYQLCYSYGYRKPNVQTRIDDFRELFVNQSYNSGASIAGFTDLDKSYRDNQSVEYPSYIGYLDISSGSTKLIPPPFSALGATIANSKADLPLSSSREDIVRTSWEYVEHFPLKAGPNLSLLARDVDSNGMPCYKPSNIAIFRMRYANWQDDYFTTSNPWQQRGDEAQIPVVGSIQVDLSDSSLSFNGTTETLYIDKVQAQGSNSWSNPMPLIVEDNTTSNPESDLLLGFNKSAVIESPSVGRFPVTYTPKGTVSGSLSGSASVSGLYVSPSAFRFAMALQHVKELQAQTDNRYKSYMRKIFGASIQDNRIDRPEFLGGSVQEINVTDVVQTSQGDSTAENTLGTLGGRGTSAKTSRVVSFYAHEHTVVIGLLHIIPDTMYLNGLAREDNVHDRFDFIMPQFARLSEQPVYNYELATRGWSHPASAAVDTNFNVFGYEPVYNYERWRKSMAVGDFRDFANSKGSSSWYKPWLVTRDFGFSFDSYSASPSYNYEIMEFVQPSLSDKFLSGRYGVDYSNFVVNDPKLMYPFICDSYFELRWTRIIPTRGIPAKLG